MKSEREELIEGLQDIIEGGGGGLDLDTPAHWAIDGIQEPIAFFRALSILLPPGGVLYMEGTSIAPCVAGFYERHAFAEPVPVVRDGISPIPEVFHVSFTPEVIDGLCDMVRERPLEQLFNHIKAYHNTSLVFTYHDAFVDELRVSGRVAEDTIRDFCAVLGATYCQEATKQRDMEQVRRFLWALENPDKARIKPEPLWRRLWNAITGR
ncbi:hypothetical protein DES53_107323 [Roseimicrobium gellanilyticum]|uniref:Uncharacterized protein n=1 Tax=Roseimicrobium gellanilyticum TaxID=748857 RepID=A0A366HHF6_9BACT|nr:hypothetical protein [Roseimicrobium gellanilyticum]RBP41490.1 hypothetical protein DES53_107323 [Roseimicrobium gellanilyticum]